MVFAEIRMLQAFLGDQAKSCDAAWRTLSPASDVARLLYQRTI
jgi:hypothetical protein